MTSFVRPTIPHRRATPTSLACVRPRRCSLVAFHTSSQLLQTSVHLLPAPNLRPFHQTIPESTATDSWARWIPCKHDGIEIAHAPFSRSFYHLGIFPVLGLSNVASTIPISSRISSDVRSQTVQNLQILTFQVYRLLKFSPPSIHAIPSSLKS